MDEKTVALEFRNLKSRQDVATFLGISDKQLRYILYGLKPSQRYRQFKIPKGNDEYRIIDAPTNQLMGIQRVLLEKLESIYRVKPSAYGFVNNKNHIMNAKQHTKNKLVLNIDLKDFFHQIHFGRIRGMFLHEPYAIGVEAATVISQIVCHEGRLPQGAPTSPILSNMICAPLDTQLMRMAEKYHIVYTRYADDISFSTYQKYFPKEIVEKNGDRVLIGDELKYIIEKNSFIINEDKISLKNNNQRQEVTGLIINEFVNIKREYIREIRTLLYSCKTKGILESALKYASTKKELDTRLQRIKEGASSQDKAEIEIENWFSLVLHGKINYIANVRGESCHYFLKYAKEYNSIFPYYHFNIEAIVNTPIQQKIRDWCFVIDNNSIQGSGFLLKGYGIMTSYHVINDFECIYDVKTEAGERVTRIINVDESDKDIDYALCSYNKSNGWEKGNSDLIIRGMAVKIIGFPNYVSGNTATVLPAIITGTMGSFGQMIWTVDKPIIHGMSGGVVLDDDHRVIGIVKAGVNSIEDVENVISGFIPINTIVKDIRNKRDLASEKA